MFEGFSAANILVLFASLAIGLAVTLGMVFAFRTSMSKTAQEIQDRVIEALEKQINSLQDKIAELEKENALHKQTLGLIRSALRKRGLIISIDGDLITINDIGGNTSYTGRITGQENS